MDGGKNVHRNLYNEEFHYAELDIPEREPRVCVRARVYICICIYVYIYIHILEYRAACFIDRDKIRLHLPPISLVAPSSPSGAYTFYPPPPYEPLLSGSCMNHDAPVSSPGDRFFVSPTFGIVFET